MKKFFFACLAASMTLLSLPVFAQEKSESDTAALLGLPGDNLDLYGVLTLFQKSKTIEAFEKSLNDEKTGINNLDLNLDKKVDFIKIVTTKDSLAFTFKLQVDVTKTETQDVALILVNKDKSDKVSIQAVGDEDLYGKDYVIEPKGNSSITANPGYTGENPVTVNVPATTTVVVQSAPIVQYVYSPAYVPYYPPYYYGFYPPWFGFATVMAVGIYRSSCWGYHGGYYGGHYGGGNTVIINNGNRNQINHNTRNTSNTVANNRANGGYGSGSANRPSAGTSNRPSAGTSNRPSTGGPSASTRPSTGGASSSTRPSTTQSNRSSSGFNSQTRPSTSNYSSGGRTRSSGGYSGGGGFSGGGSRGGGGGGRRR